MVHVDRSLFAYLNLCMTCWSFLMMFVIVFWCFKVCCIVIPSSPAWSVSVIGLYCSLNLLGKKIVYCVLVGLGTRLLLWK